MIELQIQSLRPLTAREFEDLPSGFQRHLCLQADQVTIARMFGDARLIGEAEGNLLMSYAACHHWLARLDELRLLQQRPVTRAVRLGFKAWLLRKLRVLR